MEFDSLNGDSKVKYSAIDSLLCKFSSSSLKYFNLPYLKNIYNKLNNVNNDGRVKLNHTVIRKSPIIHRGYYVRHHSFTAVLSEFINLTRSTSIGDNNNKDDDNNVTSSNNNNDSVISNNNNDSVISNNNDDNVISNNNDENVISNNNVDNVISNNNDDNNRNDGNSDKTTVSQIIYLGKREYSCILLSIS